MSKKNNSVYIFFLLILALFFSIVVRYQKNQIKELQLYHVKIEKRINILTQSMQTKDKELEAGMRNNYIGLMYKIEFIEREIGVSE